jgi:NADH-quinone oxidoreductase subunit J
MLLNLGHAAEARDVGAWRGRLAAGAVGVVLVAQLLTMLRLRLPEPGPDVAVPANAVTAVAESLFSENLVAFELTSVLLLAAIVGAVVLARRGDAPGRAEQGGGR